MGQDSEIDLKALTRYLALTERYLLRYTVYRYVSSVYLAWIPPLTLALLVDIAVVAFAGALADFLEPLIWGVAVMTGLVISMYLAQRLWTLSGLRPPSERSFMALYMSVWGCSFITSYLVFGSGPLMVHLALGVGNLGTYLVSLYEGVCRVDEVLVTVLILLGTFPILYLMPSEGLRWGFMVSAILAAYSLTGLLVAVRADTLVLKGLSDGGDGRP